jgi:hypothetical protein
MIFLERRPGDLGAAREKGFFTMAKNLNKERGEIEIKKWPASHDTI